MASKDAYEWLEASRIAIENASRAWAEERDELLDRIDDLNHADKELRKEIARLVERVRELS